MMQVCLLGQRHWSQHLADLLNRHGEGQLQAHRVGAIRDFARLLNAEVIVRVGFRPGAPTFRGLAFDAAWSVLHLLKPKAKFIFYWIGSDVVQTVDGYRDGRLIAAALSASRRDYHLAGAPWFKDELAQVGIEAESVLFPATLPSSGTEVALPSTFSILSYVPDLNPQLYGGHHLLEVAERLPHIAFHIVGGHGGWVSSRPSNLHFHGWQPDMATFFLNASVVVRMVSHDAIGGTVREALALGRHVIYSYRLPHTNYVEFGQVDDLAAALVELESAHKSGSLSLNSLGRQYALEAFDEARGTKALIRSLLVKKYGETLECE